MTLSTALPRRGRILLGHGSRDPHWRAGLDAVAHTLRQADTPCCCAFIELCPPTLHEAADALLAQGCTELCITPMFLGLGRHARHDIPELVEQLHQHLRQRQIEVPIHLEAALCDRPDFAQAMAAFIQPKGG
ncbi:hypothetical protein CCO03_12815 [Comamonas serinivorans]|uniref:Cobalamin biosynthesis protein CbiX n=1 Tax=Comamonas serinivorans TaxID=1082851 RepID=A0A1Y0EQC8_9BURK|nr:CbiX/SirB N-terminal domain-containing protein [Comamonas serinivorans]ARU05452.1 hypothetical protein CCO03_12815 [Comamonas serinivorans]